MYLLKLKAELARLLEKVRRGEADRATIDRIFDIELLLDNIYYKENTE